MIPRINISAGELFEFTRPAVFFLSAILSTWVFANARKHFSDLVALFWALEALLLPLIVLPLYLVVMINRRGKPLRQTHPNLLLTLVYGLITVAGVGLYLYQQNRGVDFHLARAAHAKVRGDRVRAIAEYQAALREEDDAHTHKLLGKELLDSGYWTEALSELRLAERGGEPDPMMFLWIGRLLDALNQNNQAELEYRRFLDSDLCTQALPNRRCELARQRMATGVN